MSSMSREKQERRKLFILLITFTITITVLVVETYAWFVGLSTVNTSSFNISVSSDSGLEISMDGEHWFKDDKTLIVNSATIAGTSTATDELTSNAYSGNTNSWVNNKGLVPVSSSGILDTSTGRLNFYEKASLSSTAGGYKLVADLINHASGETGSYVAFDLFIRNGTNTVYDNSNYDDNAAENVYLKSTSFATVNGSTGYGAANSVRVGFFMLAGMKSYGASTSDITGLSCSTTTAGVKRQLCPSAGASKALYWNIWEPNHTSHTNAVSTYFSGACKNRDSNGAYTSTPCTALGSSTVTYPVYDATSASDNVDIYDGLNNYTSSIYSSTNTTGKLANLTTYKTPGSSPGYDYNNQLFKLAGNSITRVRVYIWLEGQDPDNYDIITGDNNITINFGLTKDRYELKPQYVYSVSTSQNTIGQAIQGRQYGTFYDAKKELGSPVSNAFVLNNGLISEIYAVFEKDDKTYYLRGGVDESSLTDKPIFDANVETLKEAFGSNWSTYCSSASNSFSCNDNGIGTIVYKNGDVSASNSGVECATSHLGSADCGT